MKWQLTKRRNVATSPIDKERGFGRRWSVQVHSDQTSADWQQPRWVGGYACARVLRLPLPCRHTWKILARRAQRRRRTRLTVASRMPRRWSYSSQWGKQVASDLWVLAGLWSGRSWTNPVTDQRANARLRSHMEQWGLLSEGQRRVSNSPLHTQSRDSNKISERKNKIRVDRSAFSFNLLNDSRYSTLLYDKTFCHSFFPK